jgi:hypothetical protein
MRVSAIVVTKGDREISHVTDPLRSFFDEVIVWDNREAPKDVKIFGRYAGAYLARNEDIFIQDDDCHTPYEKLAQEYSNFFHYGSIASNFPKDRRGEYDGTKITLLGWGTYFNKRHLEVFRGYLQIYHADELFYRECDRVFSYLNYDSMRWFDFGFTHLPYAFGNDRMGREPRHREDFVEIRRRLLKLKQ